MTDADASASAGAGAPAWESRGRASLAEWTRTEVTRSEHLRVVTLRRGAHVRTLGGADVVMAADAVVACMRDDRERDDRVVVCIALPWPGARNPARTPLRVADSARAPAMYEPCAAWRGDVVPAGDEYAPTLFADFAHQGAAGPYEWSAATLKRGDGLLDWLRGYARGDTGAGAVTMATLGRGTHLIVLTQAPEYDAAGGVSEAEVEVACAYTERAVKCAVLGNGNGKGGAASEVYVLPKDTALDLGDEVLVLGRPCVAARVH